MDVQPGGWKVCVCVVLCDGWPSPHDTPTHTCIHTHIYVGKGTCTHPRRLAQSFTARSVSVNEERSGTSRMTVSATRTPLRERTPVVVRVCWGLGVLGWGGVGGMHGSIGRCHPYTHVFASTCIHKHAQPKRTRTGLVQMPEVLLAQQVQLAGRRQGRVIGERDEEEVDGDACLRVCVNVLGRVGGLVGARQSDSAG